MNSTRWLPCVVPLILGCGAGIALAGERPVPVVRTAAAEYSLKEKHTLIIDATVDLPNMCWSKPHFQTPAPRANADAQGVVSITIVADSSEGAGVACAMIYRQSVRVAPLHWTGYPPKGLKAVKVIGSRTPVIATIQTTGATPN